MINFREQGGKGIVGLLKWLSKGIIRLKSNLKLTKEMKEKTPTSLLFESQIPQSLMKNNQSLLSRYLPYKPKPTSEEALETSRKS